MNGLLNQLDQQTLRLFDGLVAFWLVLWLVVGVWTGYSVWQLSELGTTVVQSGRAIDNAGQALEGLGRIPVIGERPAEFGTQLQSTAAEIVERGVETRHNLRRLSVLLGVSIVGVPTTPVVMLYAPLRWRRRQEEQAARRFVAAHAGDPELEALLARRATATVPYSQLLQVTGESLGDNVASRLAAAELARLGLARRVMPDQP